MKRPLQLVIFFSLIILNTISFAQKVELSAGISGNLSNFGGTAASTNVGAYAFPIFSKKLTAGYGLNAQIKAVAQDGFIMGLQTGYDELRTKANVNSYLVLNYFAGGSLGAILDPADSYGYETTVSKFINLNPFLGYRIKKKTFNIDFTLGANIGFAVEDKHTEVYTKPSFYNQSYYYNRSNLSYTDIHKQDIRIKAGAGFSYRRFGVDVSYEHGVNNLINPKHNFSYYNPPGSAYSQIIKLGVNYRIF